MSLLHCSRFPLRSKPIRDRRLKITDADGDRREANLSPEAAQSSAAEIIDRNAGGTDEFSKFSDVTAVDAQIADQLLGQWGDEFDTNLDFPRQAVSRFADQSIIEALEETGLGNDPRIVDMAAKVGRLLQNSSFNSVPKAEDTERIELITELEALAGSPDYWEDECQKRVRQIHIALHIEDPVPLYEKGNTEI